VAFYTLLAIWRLRRASLREQRRAAMGFPPDLLQPAARDGGTDLSGVCITNEAQPQGK
jgi:hypothetical protein